MTVLGQRLIPPRYSRSGQEYGSAAAGLAQYQSPDEKLNESVAPPDLSCSTPQRISASRLCF
jgi:hypothetical protein